jgi:hypothetical protein
VLEAAGSGLESIVKVDVSFALNSLPKGSRVRNVDVGKKVESAREEGRGKWNCYQC